MGLVIKPKGEKKIIIKGTEIEMPEVYGRIEFASRKDGKTIEVAVSTYASKQAFKEGASVLSTTVQQGNFVVELQEGEVQNVDVALAYTKTALEQQGYDVNLNTVAVEE